MAVDLPAADDCAGITDYAHSVVEAVGDRGDLIVVAQSMGGFTAPLVCDRVPVKLIVLLNAMVPTPGESAGDWWANAGQFQAQVEKATRDGRATGGDFDPLVDFFHDVPVEVTAQALAMGEQRQSGTPFEKPWPLERWPDVPTRFLQASDDRFFPVEFQRRVVKERLGLTIDEMPGGHLIALARPQELADRLEAYRLELGE